MSIWFKDYVAFFKDAEICKIINYFNKNALNVRITKLNLVCALLNDMNFEYHTIRLKYRSAFK